MAKDPKTLCKWGKDDIKEGFKELKKIVGDARFICRKCARVARNQEYLCKPDEL